MRSRVRLLVRRAPSALSAPNEGSSLCSAPTRPARCVPSTSARPSRSLAGSPAVATTAAWPSSTCGMPREWFRSSCATKSVAHELRSEYCLRVTGDGLGATGGQRQPRAADGRDRGRGDRRRGAQRVGTAAVPDRRPRRGRRGGAAALPLPRPPPLRAGRARSDCAARSTGRRARCCMSGRSSRSRRRRSPVPRPRVPATSWCPRVCSRAAGTPCRRARSCSSSC